MGDKKGDCCVDKSVRHAENYFGYSSHKAYAKLADSVSYSSNSNGNSSY